MNKITEQLNKSRLERKFFWFLFLLLLLFSLVYAYLVNQTVLNIVTRENIESEIVTLNSKISDIESNYITMTDKINIDYAHSLGFVNVRKIKFASRKTSSQSLSLLME